MVNGDLVKRVSVKKFTFAKTIINIWTNDREITSSQNSYLSSDRADSQIVINLGKRLKKSKTYASVRPYQREFLEPLSLKIDNIEMGTTLRYTLDASELSINFTRGK